MYSRVVFAQCCVVDLMDIGPTVVVWIKIGAVVIGVLAALLILSSYHLWRSRKKLDGS
jgi:hypothetical protein